MLNVTNHYKRIFMLKAVLQELKQRFYVKDLHYFPANIFKDQTISWKTISTKKLIKDCYFVFHE